MLRWQKIDRSKLQNCAFNTSRANYFRREKFKKLQGCRNWGFAPQKTVNRQ